MSADLEQAVRYRNMLWYLQNREDIWKLLEVISQKKKAKITIDDTICLPEEKEMVRSVM